MPEVPRRAPGRVDLGQLPPQGVGLPGQGGDEGVDGPGVLDVSEQLAAPAAQHVPLQLRDQPHQLVALRGREVFGLTHSQSMKTCSVPHNPPTDADPANQLHVFVDRECLGDRTYPSLSLHIEDTTGLQFVNDVDRSVVLVC